MGHTSPNIITGVAHMQYTRTAALTLLLGLEPYPDSSLGACNTHLRPDDFWEIRMALLSCSLDERRELDDEGRGRESGGWHCGGSWGDEKQRQEGVECRSQRRLRIPQSALYSAHNEMERT